MRDIKLKSFSEKALQSLEGYYVYALIDPRTDNVFYIGKGTENRVFDHEIEKDKNPYSEKAKLIKEIEEAGLQVKRVIINKGLFEGEAFAAEASLINLLNYVNDIKLSNIVAGHHFHECITVEDFEQQYGAERLTQDDIKHNILVIKINKKYHRGMNADELYDIVRGFWKASMRSIKSRKIEYVFGVYNQIVVAVYKPEEWHYVYENIDIPRADELKGEEYEKLKNRLYFTCKDHKTLDNNQEFYLNKSIAGLKINKSSQNPISYLMPKKADRLLQIQDFARKWSGKFRNERINYLEFVEIQMGDEISELGFKMDNGLSFMEVYGEAINDEEKLRSIIEGIDNIELLGSAIYSKWRYFNHYAYSGAEILEPKNRNWFVIALDRLAVLARED